MPKSPAVKVIIELDAEDQRRFYADLTASFYLIFGCQFSRVEDFRMLFQDLRRDLNDYRATLDAILSNIAPDYGLTWRDFTWIRENRWKKCAVCDRIYLDYSNGKSKTCYLDEYLRFSLQSREFINNIDYRGKSKSLCSAKYTAWKKRGRTGPMNFIMFRKGEFI
ncbi:MULTISPECIES: hypothetical protein [Actinomycetes]|uniref:hypothetical protein n=1 Tax=Streptomyces TaxID=1883 RepID=UPI003332D3F8